MKKVLMTIMLVVILIPLFVNAESCDPSSITIGSIELTNKHGNAEELNQASIDGKKVNLDLKLFDVGDYVEYELKVKNTSDEDFYFDENSLNFNADYVTYEFVDSNVVEAGKENTIKLKVEYSNEVPKSKLENGVYNNVDKMTLQLSNDDAISVPNTLKNLNIKNIIIIALLVSTIVVGIILIALNPKKRIKYMILVLGTISILPIVVNGLCKCEIEVESNITIDKASQISENIYWALSDKNSENHYETLTISNQEIDGEEKGSFSGETIFESPDQVPWLSAYYENNKSSYVNKVIIEGLVVPKSTAYWFYYTGYNASSFTADLTNLYTSKATSMAYMFCWSGYNATTWTLGDISDWDTANVTNMYFMFANAGYNATTFELDLSEWNTSKVTDMNGMFTYAGYSATTWKLGDLTDWKTSQVTDMYYMFFGSGYNAAIWDIGNLSEWNTGNVTNMAGMFANAGYNATTFELDLSSWNTSSVTTMNGMFSSTGHEATTWDVGNLSEWNTSKVTDMYFMFTSAGIKATAFELDLSNWDTSNVTNMTSMFEYSGYSATTWSVTIPKTNSNGIDNTTIKMYGKTESVYGEPLSGKSFILSS